MTSPSTSTHEWDFERLRDELQRQTEIRDNLLRTNTQMQQAVENAEKMLKQQKSSNEGCVWREHYLQQQAHNQQLEAQLKQLERKLVELKSQMQQANEHEVVGGYEGMSDVGMRKLLRKLEKEKAELEWQLKDCEWRLDQEAAAVHRAEEEKKAILTELGQASLELEKNKQKMVQSVEEPKKQSHHHVNESTKTSKH